MPRKRRDLQIFWIVLLSLAFWLAIFQHEDVLRLANATWTIAREVVAKLH